MVPDLDAAMQNWLTRYGIGPWITMRGAQLDAYEYRNVASSPAIDLAFAQSGEMQLELIAPIDDEPSAYRDFLTSGREGLQHLAWWTDQYDRVEQAGREAGWSILQRGRFATTRFSYFEDVHEHDLAVEIMELDDSTRWLDQHIRAAAQDWDGATEPIRPLF